MTGPKLKKVSMLFGAGQVPGIFAQDIERGQVQRGRVAEDGRSRPSRRIRSGIFGR